LIWVVTPQTGGGRFIMPYLPAFSILSIASIGLVKNSLLKKYMLSLIVIVAASTLLYRGAASIRFLPILIGTESKHEFLSKNLNFEFGDFYDTDYFFKNNIKNTDNVLIYGGHNLYYADFPFVHESYVRTGDKFNYVLVQNTSLPVRFSDWEHIYENKKTNVKLYTKGKMTWEY
jgi:hypothetical protein